MKVIALIAAFITVISASGAGEPIWGYEGDLASPYWYKQGDSFLLCNTGKKQSPINIDTRGVHLTDDRVKLRALSDVTLTWANAKDLDATIYNTGHGIKVQGSNFQVARSKLRNTNYKVLQFHMHTPSEHHINGRFAPLELHFVHEKVSEPGQGKYAVIGVMFHLDETKASPLLDQIIAKLSSVSHAGDSAPFGTIDLSTFFATEVEGLADGFYNYIGSLTTPPCSEAVYWWVAQNHATMTAEQYNALKAVMGFSARHTLSRGYFK